MERTIKFTLPNNQDIIETISEYNKACNFCLETGFKKHTFNKNDLHKLTYKKVRKKFDLQSSLVQCARDQASDMLKREKLKKLPFKKEFSSIRFNLRTFTFNPKTEIVSISTLKGRVKIKPNIQKYFLKYLVGKIKSATLGFSNGEIFGRFICEIETPEKLEVNSVLGIDRGIIYPVVSSNNQFFNSKHLRRIKGKYQWLKSQLQSKGTKSAKRHLKRLSGKSQRFVRDVNHVLSKRIVEMPFEAFSFEKLQIRRQKKNGRKFNKRLGNWSPKQLLTFVEYKAEALGKTIVFVNSAYTSQVCSSCGHKAKTNRKGLSFKCLKCGFCLHSDLNASRNIAELGKAEFSRQVVNLPIVASLNKHQAELQAT